MRIVVDKRERNSGIPELLKQSGVFVDFATLKVGDYIVFNNVVIERKTVPDLLSSFYDGRLFIQCSQLVKHFSSPLLIYIVPPVLSVYREPLGASPIPVR